MQGNLARVEPGKLNREERRELDEFLNQLRKGSLRVLGAGVAVLDYPLKVDLGISQILLRGSEPTALGGPAAAGMVAVKRFAPNEIKETLVTGLGAPGENRTRLENLLQSAMPDIRIIDTSKGKGVTSFTFIVEGPEHSKLFLHNPGANETITGESIKGAIESGRHDIVLSAGFGPLRSLNADGLKKVISVAKSTGSFVAVSTQDPGTETVPGFGSALLQQPDLVVVSESDIKGFPGMPKNPLAASRWLVEQGAEVGVITLGERGSIVSEEGFEGIKSTYVPALKVDPKATTGCGDTYGAIFAYLRKMALDEKRSGRSALPVAHLALIAAIAAGKVAEEGKGAVGVPSAQEVAKVVKNPKTPYSDFHKEYAP